MVDRNEFEISQQRTVNKLVLKNALPPPQLVDRL
jgi:hypothetical protein